MMIGNYYYPMIINSNGGGGDGLMYLAILIFLNLIWFGIVLVRTFLWLIWKRKVNRNFGYPLIHKFWRFWDYCIWDRADESWINFATIIWLTANGITILIVGSWWIYHLLGGSMPLN